MLVYFFHIYVIFNIMFIISLKFHLLYNLFKCGILGMYSRFGQAESLPEL